MSAPSRYASLRVAGTIVCSESWKKRLDEGELQMADDSRRRALLGGTAALLSAAVLPLHAGAAAPPDASAGPAGPAGGGAPDRAVAGAVRRRAVELTFLKSRPGDRERLRQFIVLNWFAMDAIAKARGLMSAYTVLDSGADDGEWNVLVVVTYPDERGYEGIAPQFEAIRREHRTVPVDGRGLRDLGAIVGSKRVYEEIRDAAT